MNAFTDDGEPLETAPPLTYDNPIDQLLAELLVREPGMHPEPDTAAEWAHSDVVTTWLQEGRGAVDETAAEVLEAFRAFLVFLDAVPSIALEETSVLDLEQTWTRYVLARGDKLLAVLDIEILLAAGTGALWIAQQAAEIR